jgi:ankyrin repeat protein
MTMDEAYDVQVVDEENDKPNGFLKAIFEGDTEEVSKFLMQQTTNVKNKYLAMRDDDGFPPLFIASKLGHEEIVKILLGYQDRGVDVNEVVLPTTDPNLKDKALQDLIKTLASCGAPLQKVQRLRFTALLLASKHGHPRVVELLLKGGAKVNTCTGTTALRTASGFLHEECVRLLLAHGAGVSICQPQTGGTPLFSASMVGHVGIATMLIERGANVNDATWGRNCTCLMIATFMKHTGMVELLLKHGADPNRVNKEGLTALWFAAKKGNAAKDMQVLLLKHGAKATPGLLFFSTLFSPSTAIRLWKHRAWSLPNPAPKESLSSKQPSSIVDHSPLINKEVATGHYIS